MDAFLGALPDDLELQDVVEGLKSLGYDVPIHVAEAMFEQLRSTVPSVPATEFREGSTAPDAVSRAPYDADFQESGEPEDEDDVGPFGDYRAGPEVVRARKGAEGPPYGPELRQWGDERREEDPHGNDPNEERYGAHGEYEREYGFGQGGPQEGLMDYNAYQEAVGALSEREKQLQRRPEFLAQKEAERRRASRRSAAVTGSRRRPSTASEVGYRESRDQGYGKYASPGNKNSLPGVLVKRPSTGKKKFKTDPVLRYQKQRAKWAEDSFLSGDRDSRRFRESVPTSQVQKKPQKNMAKMRYSYVAPTSKRRDDLRWQVRTKLFFDDQSM